MKRRSIEKYLVTILRVRLIMIGDEDGLPTMTELKILDTDRSVQRRWAHYDCPRDGWKIRRCVG